MHGLSSYFKPQPSQHPPITTDGDHNDDSNNGSTTVAAEAPVINGISAPTVLSVNQTGTWTVNASDPQNSQLTYSVNWGDNGPLPFFFNFMNTPVFTQSASFSHAYANPGTYTVTFTVRDSAGLSTSSSLTIQVTALPTPLVLSNVTATSTGSTTATISWNSNLQGDTELWLGTTTPVTTSSTPLIDVHNAVTAHSVTLSGLTASTTYYAVVGTQTTANGITTMATSSPVQFITASSTATSTSS